MVSPEVHQVIALPDGVTANIAAHTVTVKGSNGELSRRFWHPSIEVRQENGSIVVHADLPRRKTRALAGTWSSHLRNMVKGVQTDYEYKLKICYSHFPIKTKVQGDRFLVENFLGERTPRKARIQGATKVKVSGDEVLCTGPDIEAVSQTAANIEQACRIRGYDIRVFQDGIYITSKGGD